MLKDYYDMGRDLAVSVLDFIDPSATSILEDQEGGPFGHQHWALEKLKLLNHKAGVVVPESQLVKLLSYKTYTTSKI